MFIINGFSQHSCVVLFISMQVKFLLWNLALASNDTFPIMYWPRDCRKTVPGMPKAAPLLKPTCIKANNHLKIIETTETYSWVSTIFILTKYSLPKRLIRISRMKINFLSWMILLCTHYQYKQRHESIYLYLSIDKYILEVISKLSWFYKNHSI